MAYSLRTGAFRAIEETGAATEYDILENNKGAGGVKSFNGRSGKVMPKSGDYTADMVGAAEKVQTENALLGKVDTTTFESFKESNTEAINGKVSKNQTANGSDLGLVKADAKGTEDDIPAKIGSDGKLYISSQAVIDKIASAEGVSV